MYNTNQNQTASEARKMGKPKEKDKIAIEFGDEQCFMDMNTLGKHQSF